MKAEKVSYEGFDVKVFRDGSEILEDIWIVVAKHLKHDVFILKKTSSVIMVDNRKQRLRVR